MRLVLLSVVLALAGISVDAFAAPSATAQREITMLMDTLGQSDCRFKRNKTWYNATDARAHMQRKYNYLFKRDLADTAELFIERAATQSSVSGKLYKVECPGDAEQDAGVWFSNKLQQWRSSQRASTGNNS